METGRVSRRSQLAETLMYGTLVTTATSHRLCLFHVLTASQETSSSLRGGAVKKKSGDYGATHCLTSPNLHSRLSAWRQLLSVMYPDFCISCLDIHIHIKTHFVYIVL